MEMENNITVSGIKIYSLKYLINNDLTESDLNNLFETDSLIYSIIVNMYMFINSKKSYVNIVKDIRKNNDWISRNKWSNKERNLYEHKLKDAFKNIYSLSDEIALQKAQWYMTIYGFDIK